MISSRTDTYRVGLKYVLSALIFLCCYCGPKKAPPGPATGPVDPVGLASGERPLPEPGKEIEDRVALAEKQHSLATKIPVVPPGEQKPSLTISRESAYLRDRLGYLVERRLVELHERGPATVIVLTSPQLFASGSTRLSASGRRLVLQVNEILVGLRGKRFAVEGHADERRGRTSNWDLGYRRAMAVVQLMIAHHMPSYRISASSYGSTRPQETDDTAEGRALNRRVEIAVVDDHFRYPQDDNRHTTTVPIYRSIDPARSGPDGRTIGTEYEKYLREKGLERP